MWYSVSSQGEGGAHQKIVVDTAPLRLATTNRCPKSPPQLAKVATSKVTKLKINYYVVCPVILYEKRVKNEQCSRIHPVKRGGLAHPSTIQSRVKFPVTVTFTRIGENFCSAPALRPYTSLPCLP